MTFMGELAEIFDKAFDKYEQKHMYPLGYGKESAVKKMSLDHAGAIATSRLFLHKALDRSPEPKFRLAIEKDIELLGEVRSFILHGLFTPNLPWKGEGVEDGPKTVSP